jgi:hypothetical protein
MKRLRTLKSFQIFKSEIKKLIHGTIGLFRRNSGCSPEQKTLGIPFRTIPQRRKQLGIPFGGTKIEENTWNSVPNHSAEEKPTRNSVPWNKNRSRLSEFRSEACLGGKKGYQFSFLEQVFCKTNFFLVIPFRSELRN